MSLHPTGTIRAPEKPPRPSPERDDAPDDAPAHPFAAAAPWETVFANPQLRIKVGRRIFDQRRAIKLSQRGFATSLDVPITRVQDIEGGAPLSPGQVRHIAHLLQCKPSAIVQDVGLEDWKPILDILQATEPDPLLEPPQTVAARLDAAIRAHHQIGQELVAIRAALKAGGVLD